ncbi:hypothetical protein [Cryobacterium zhongshanensis]|uniref:Uncharacterized protein n=1 Tax=Cryobacterium zhongshanensis TaxID=2928153 RepID=A0AA41QY50_9MICO|nr:hypothetical protein [Cryobacterium zhongshanensis]MCI4659622.1 hypothetical protein [Cryobacterium zhongshanensis]
MYKHLLIIADAELLENTLHTSVRTRAERLIVLLSDGTITKEISDEVVEAMREADLEAAQADYPEGTRIHPLDAEDYLDTIRDVLANNDIEIYLDELETPDEIEAATQRADRESEAMRAA